MLSALSEIEHIWGKQEDKTRTTSERKLVVHKKLSSAYHRSVSDTSSRVEVILQLKSAKILIFVQLPIRIRLCGSELKS